MTEPRKATDILLDLESKLNTALEIMKAQDFSIKILSNKLNDVMEKLNKQQASPQRIVVEAVQTQQRSPMPANFPQIPVGDPDRTIPVSMESTLPQTNAPDGFRRNSRPETYAGDNALLQRPEAKMPIQLPKQAEVQMPANKAAPPPGRTNELPTEFISRGPPVPPKQAQMPNMEQQDTSPIAVQGQIPLMQRVVDKNGKSIFLANVEVIDLSNGQLISKTRTNGTGKWMASLALGQYRATISKGNSLSKSEIKSVQDITVDGKQSPLELPMLIIK